MEPIFHLALASDWAAAQADGQYVWSTRGMLIDEVGFMHASFREQVTGVFDRFYRDVTDDLLLLHLDTAELERLGLKVIVEPADPGDPDSEHFPHVYGGALPTSAVAQVEPFHRA